MELLLPVIQVLVLFSFIESYRCRCKHNQAAAAGKHCREQQAGIAGLYAAAALLLIAAVAGLRLAAVILHACVIRLLRIIAGVLIIEGR